MSFFALVSLLIALAAVSSSINDRFIRLPPTVGVMLVSLLGSLTLVLVGPFTGGFRPWAVTLVASIDFNQVVPHGILAFLIFAGAIHVKLEALGREWAAVSLLAVVGTLVSTFVVGGATWVVLGWLGVAVPFLQALLFGALVSPTGPVAVLAVMRSVGVTRQLEVQAAGEHESSFLGRAGRCGSRASTAVRLPRGRWLAGVPARIWSVPLIPMNRTRGLRTGPAWNGQRAIAADPNR